ncbi:hypothetical protein N9B53_03805 [Mariniblastus sp.]|mgnify:CR=1 FL=1|jgi:hypothetical protein|nr:hypothetical protein [Mariniblastus sp.]
MPLRPELDFPALDETKIARLTELAMELDGAGAGQCDVELREFNESAGLLIPISEFQGISGGMSHESWVRSVLCEPFVASTPMPTSEEALVLITRLMSADGEEWELTFWIDVLEKHLDPRISDLIYWPGEYFGDGNNNRELSPEDILETALNSKTV